MQESEGQVIVIQEGLKYITQELKDIKETLKSFATQKEMESLTRRVADLEVAKEKQKDEFTSLAIKVASVAATLAIVGELIISHVIPQ